MDASQLAAFLAWSVKHSEFHAAWYVLAMTGMRRGELLALRWQDVDQAAGTATVARSATLVRVRGKGATVVIGPPKSGKPRTVDLDDATVALLRAHKSARGTVHLSLAQPGALVFGDIEDRGPAP